MNAFVTGEIAKAREVLDCVAGDAHLLATLQAAGDTCARTLADGGKVMFCGNGGSAADAQHLAAELVGKLQLVRPGLAGLALTTDTSALTAIGNDFGYDHVFARQVEALGRPGDTLVGITTSGRSPNVLAALEKARSKGIATIGLTGNGAGSRDLEKVSDHCLKVPSEETQKIQEAHIVLGHILCALAEQAAMGEPESIAGQA